MFLLFHYITAYYYLWQKIFWSLNMNYYYEILKGILWIRIWSLLRKIYILYSKSSLVYQAQHSKNNLCHRSWDVRFQRTDLEFFTVLFLFYQSSRLFIHKIFIIAEYLILFIQSNIIIFNLYVIDLEMSVFNVLTIYFSQLYIFSINPPDYLCMEHSFVPNI